MQYWRHLFALDSQLLWFQQQNILELGHWMQRKRAHILDHQTNATSLLKQSGVPLDVLEHEWRAQRNAQLEKLPHIYLSYLLTKHLLILLSGQSKNLADHTITSVIEEQRILQNMKKKLKKMKGGLQQIMTSGAVKEVDVAQAGVNSITSEIARIESSIAKKRLVLGFMGKGSLKKLKGNAFLQICTNALALRQRIVQNLIAHKFEMEKMECLVRHGDQMGECFPFI
jgi:hypothetical protein